jgi:hypothetical protein
MFAAVRIVFYMTAAITAIIIFQILTTSQYHVGLGLAVVLASYLLAAVSLALLGYKMLSWYRSRRNLSTLLFAVTFLTAAIGFANVPIANSVYFFSANPLMTEQYYADYGYQPDSDGKPAPHFSPRKSDSLFALYSLTIRILNVPYFPLWASAIVLVRDYAKTIGRSKFLAITILPGLIFPIQIAESASGGLFPPLFASMYGAAALALAALFIGIIFFVTARTMKRLHGQYNPISRILIITGFGFVLGLIASSPAVHLIDRVHTPFPPFGVLPWAFIGFAAFLASSGFYHAATTISQDVNIRKSVRRSAIETSKLLDSIGMAQMEQEMRQAVEKVAKEQEEKIREETGIEQRVSEEEVQEYLEEVLEEIKKTRTKGSAAAAS